MRLGWYINRLRGMEPAEIVHRVREAARRRLSRHRHEGWARFPAASRLPQLLGLREALLRADAAARAAIAAAAETLLAGRYEALGRRWPDRDPAALFPPALWRLDPVTGGDWPGPDTYAFDIDFRHDGSRGDVKYVWEINRLQFLLPLAAHAVLADDGRSLVAIEAAIGSWHAANPPFRGLGWASGIEVALRAISLLVTATLVGDLLDEPTRRQLGEILAASAFWLPRFPSRFSSANNHLVAELAGEVLIALALGEAPGPARDRLIAEIDRQLLADGSGAEQTPTYAAFTAELALLAASVSRAAGQPFPPGFDARLAAFADFVHWLGGDGATPPLGDDDEGRVLSLGPEPDYPRSVASAIAGYCEQPGIAPAPGDIRALLYGRPRSIAPAPQGLRTFPDGGLSVWHGSLAGRRASLGFDHGPLGYLSIAAHGHADALSFTLSLDGEPVLVDPGTYLYGSGGIWRDWFRSTAAHNTLNLDGISQSTAAGAFNWTHKARAEFVAAEDGPEPRLAARHDGYLGRFGVVHERSLVIEATGLTLTDRLRGGPSRPAELVLQLAPGLATRRDSGTVTVLRGGEPLLAITLPPGEIAIAAGGEPPGAGGWVAPRFGERLPAERLAWRGEVGEAGVVTRLVVAPATALDTPGGQT